MSRDAVGIVDLALSSGFGSLRAAAVGALGCDGFGHLPVDRDLPVLPFLTRELLPITGWRF
jgi:hypothetical protein